MSQVHTISNVWPATYNKRGFIWTGRKYAVIDGKMQEFHAWALTPTRLINKLMKKVYDL